MFGVANDKINGTGWARVAQVVQGARSNRIAAGAAAATAATPRREVAAWASDTRLGKILDAGIALSNVGDVLAWARHGSPSVRNCPPIFILRLLRPDSVHP